MNNNANKKKEDRQSLYVTVVVILMMVAIVVAIATSLARNTGEAEKPTDTTLADAETKAPAGTELKDDEKDSIDTEDVFFGNDDKDKGEGSEKEDEKGEDTKKTDADGKKEPASSLPEFVAPVRGEVLKGCSLEVPVFSLTLEDYRTHSGVDLYCSPGSDVAAVADGTVKRIWDDPMMGTCISVEHSGGAVSVYKNLCEDIPGGIEEGTSVKGGQIIATSADTALLEIAEESHLHFELYLDDVAQDPEKYIEFTPSEYEE